MRENIFFTNKYQFFLTFVCGTNSATNSGTIKPGIPLAQFVKPIIKLANFKMINNKRRC
jgi:hypothetical protein